MASNKLIILEGAVSELEDTCLYYNCKVVGLGFEFEQEVYSLLELIKEKPLIFPIKFAHIHEAVMKRFPFVIRGHSNHFKFNRILDLRGLIHKQMRENFVNTFKSLVCKLMHTLVKVRLACTNGVKS